MYRIAITRKDIYPGKDEPAEREKIVEVYAQSFDELDVAALITAINKKPRTRGPRKKKGEAK